MAQQAHVIYRIEGDFVGQLVTIPEGCDPTKMSSIAWLELSLREEVQTTGLAENETPEQWVEEQIAHSKDVGYEVVAVVAAPAIFYM